MPGVTFVPPDDYHVLVLAGGSFYIDTEVRREIESYLRERVERAPILVVDSLVGEEITIVEGQVFHIFSTSTDSRDKERAMVRAFRTELPVEDL